MSMVVRVNKTSDYTVMSNVHLKDTRLTLKAKGLLSVVLSLPSDWRYSVAGLASISKEKETSIKTALDELRENGYLVITKKMPNETQSGRIEYEWDFYEKPTDAKQEVKKQGIENLPLENLMLENQGQSNTNISNTKVLNTKELDISPISPLEKIVTTTELLFKEFWAAYPRKDDKKRAWLKFKAIKNLEKVFPDIMADVENKKKSEQWNKNGGQFIPMPSTYLNNERWNDEETITRQDEIESKCADELKGFF